MASSALLLPCCQLIIRYCDLKFQDFLHDRNALLPEVSRTPHPDATLEVNNGPDWTERRHSQKSEPQPPAYILRHPCLYSPIPLLHQHESATHPMNVIKRVLTHVSGSSSLLKPRLHLLPRRSPGISCRINVSFPFV